MNNTFDEFYETYMLGRMRNANKYRSFLRKTYDESNSIRDFIGKIHYIY